MVVTEVLPDLTESTKSTGLLTFFFFFKSNSIPVTDQDFKLTYRTGFKTMESRCNVILIFFIYTSAIDILFLYLNNRSSPFYSPSNLIHCNRAWF